MYWLKQCTKCGGDLASNSDQYGPYVSCMQCGRYQETEFIEARSPAATVIANLPEAATTDATLQRGTTHLSLSGQRRAAISA